MHKIIKSDAFPFVEEDSSAQVTAVNVLADLLPRCDGEQEYLLRWLQSPEAKGLTLRMKNMTLVELKVCCLSSCLS